MSILSLALFGSALAADVAAGGSAPDMNAQTFRPSTDSLHFFRLTDSAVGPAGTLGWRATTSYARNMLVWTDIFGEEQALVANLVQTDLGVGWSFGKARVAVDIPVVIRNFGGITEDATGLGDVTLDAKYRILDGGWGLAVSGRGLLPTSTMDAPLAGSIGGEFEVVADHKFGEKLLAAASLGTILREAQDMENVGWGSQLHVGLGASYAVTESLSAVAEFDVNGVVGSLGDALGRPSEVLLGANVKSGDMMFRPAVAVGLGDAPGVPAYRAILAVSNVPKVKIVDADKDGVLDDVDACPAAPEDIDAYSDTDGCPEPTEVTIKIVDSDGQVVTDGAWKVGEASGKHGEVAKLPAGDATVTVGAVQKAYTVPAGAPTEVVITVPAPRGSLVVNIVDKDGKPVPNATWSASGPTDLKAQPAGTYALRPGNYVLAASAPGYKKLTESSAVQKDGTINLTLTIEPAKAELSAAKIEIKDSVYFETNLAVIKPESFGLLDEIVEILKDHPELTKLRVEGHTDTRGDNAANKALSQARADSVVKYLTEKGIAAGRLEAMGYGEEKPLVKPEKTDKDRADNRRVAFFVAARSDTAAPGDVKKIETKGDAPKVDPAKPVAPTPAKPADQK